MESKSSSSLGLLSEDMAVLRLSSVLVMMMMMMTSLNDYEDNDDKYDENYDDELKG